MLTVAWRFSTGEAGPAYANVHTAAFPGGAIRGQLSSADDDQGDDD